VHDIDRFSTYALTDDFLLSCGKMLTR